ncbi:4Fe-4S binding protein [Desulfovibrio mangrovi]|uniref:4Fe-4S binding protein n=1 Tax=Desulfovibrio mangrovi TaxID=2976983 RepID=UPI002247DB8C|nr:4Fe-4S binding protein [Desulfovibrio mangrovi]UZP67974.1 4Fe-4S binding protein [Desulfovibrio mangrovi]
MLGLILLGAHSLRAGTMWDLFAVLVVAGLCLTRQSWGRLIAALVLLGGCFVWVRTGMGFVQMRMMLGQDWMRLACIMGGVTVFSFAGALVLLSGRADRRFHARKSTALPQAFSFALTAVLLWVCREKAARINLLLADRFIPDSGVLEIALVAVYGAVVCGLLLDRKKARKVRPFIWAMFSAVFFGQLALGLAGVERLLMTGDLHLPVPALIVAGPLFRGGGFFMLILFAVSVLLVGPAWCSHLCYIGAWDDRLSRMQHGAPKPLPRWATYFRWGLAAVVLGAALAMRLAGVSVLVAVWLAALLGLAGVTVMVVVSSRTGTMAHCSAYCPLGLVGNVLGRISLWRLRITDRCTRCGACQRVCRYNALPDDALELGRPSLSCSLCRDCTTVCTHGAMELRFPGLSSATSERLFVTIAATLHAVFVAVARM